MLECKARCWAEIDLDALVHNYKSALDCLTGGAKLICVLKANAYGLGAVKASQTLYDAGARFFAVACLQEALEIKDALPQADVMVLGLVGEDETGYAIERGIIFTVYSRRCADIVAAKAAELKLEARVQLKADTGLHRLGFEFHDAGFCAEFAKKPYIKVEGLFTHLALRSRESDEKQFSELLAFDAALKAAGVSGYMLHACDSIGMLRYPERHMDAVRTGAWLFGVPPYTYNYDGRCLPTLAFKTRVSQIRTVKAGECIGYDDDHPLKNDCRVATLSAGYVDGFPRLNNEGSVLIRGKKANVLGLVCMDQMMVDISDIPECEEGDIAAFIGEGVLVNDYARAYHLNHNEALCRVGRRVPRIYTYKGRTEVLF